MKAVRKRLEVSAAHNLDLPYNSKCQELHGHNWIIEVEISAEQPNKEGMVMDFTTIKKVVMSLDHQNLNSILGNTNTTAENIAKWVADKVNEAISNETPMAEQNRIAHVTKVMVQESEGNIVWYQPTTKQISH